MATNTTIITTSTTINTTNAAAATTTATSGIKNSTNFYYQVIIQVNLIHTLIMTLRQYCLNFSKHLVIDCPSVIMHVK